MILNPMYKTTDYSKTYCISKFSVDEDPDIIGSFAISYQGGVLDIYFGKPEETSIPPCQRVFCSNLFIQGTLRGSGLSMQGDPGPVRFTLNANRFKIYISLMFDQGWNQGYEMPVKRFGCTEFARDDSMLTVELCNGDTGEPEPPYNMVHIQAKLPWSQISNLKEFNLVDYLGNNQDKNSLMWLQTVLMAVKCYKDA